MEALVWPAHACSWKNEGREKGRRRRRRGEIYIGRRRIHGEGKFVGKASGSARLTRLSPIRGKKFSRECVVHGGGGGGNYYRVIAPRETNKRLGFKRAREFARIRSEVFLFLFLFQMNEIKNGERDEEIM